MTPHGSHEHAASRSRAPQLSLRSIAVHEVAEVSQFLGDVLFHVSRRFLPPEHGVVMEEEFWAKRTGFQRVGSDKFIAPVPGRERCLDAGSCFARAVERAACFGTPRLPCSVLGVSARDAVPGLPHVKEARLRRGLVAISGARVPCLEHGGVELNDIDVSARPPVAALFLPALRAMFPCRWRGDTSSVFTHDASSSRWGARLSNRLGW